MTQATVQPETPTRQSLLSITPLTRRRSGNGRVLLHYQAKWCNDNSRLKLWPKARRIGADYGEAYDAVEKRTNKQARGYRRSNYWYSSADESAAYETAEYWRFWLNTFQVVADHFTEEVADPATGRTARAFCVQIPDSPARLTAMTSNPRRFRSKGGDVCLSEVDFHDDPMGMHKAAYPTITWGDSYKVLSTHNGEGNVMHRWRQMAERHARGQARQGDIPWSVHLTTILDAVADGLVDKINSLKGATLTDEQFLNDLRAGCETEEQWLEEFMAVPAMDSYAWLSYDLIEACEVDGPMDGSAFGDGPRYLGADFGETTDPHMVKWYESVGDVLVCRERIKMVSKNTPLHVVEKIVMDRVKHPRTVRACVDSGGPGTQIGQAVDRSHKGEGIKFTNASMDEMATALKGRFEDRRIREPRDARESLHKVRKETTASGNPRFVADRSGGEHAEDFWASALACHAAKVNVAGGFGFGPVEIEEASA